MTKILMTNDILQALNINDALCEKYSTKLEEIQYYLSVAKIKPYPKHFKILNHLLKLSNNTNSGFKPIKGTMLERTCHLNILVNHVIMRKVLFTTPDSNLILIKLDQRSFPKE